MANERIIFLGIHQSPFSVFFADSSLPLSILATEYSKLSFQNSPLSTSTSQLSSSSVLDLNVIYISVQSLSCVGLFVTPWTAACQASLSITNSQSLLKLKSIESVMPSNHLILCHPLLPSIFPSIRVFSNESVHSIRWPKYCSFSFSINPSNEYSGLISFRMDWLDLLAVQGTLKNLLQHHSSKASVRELCIRLLYSCIFSIVSSLAVSSTFLGLMWLYVQGAFGGLCPGVVE